MVGTMKLGHRNVEWMVTATLIVTVVTLFLIFPAVSLNIGATAITQAFTNVILLLIFASLLVSMVVLLRLYGKLDEIEKTLKARKGLAPAIGVALLLFMAVATFVLAYVWLANVQLQAGLAMIK